MSISAPIILLPSGGADYTTDTKVQTLSGTTSANTFQIQVNGTVVGVSYTPGDTAWAWTGSLAEGSNTFSVVAVERTTHAVSVPTVINITYTRQDLSVTVSAPTGVSLKRYQDKIEAICAQNAESNVVGYNFYVSYNSGGVNNEYVKFNDQLVTVVSFYEDAVRQLNQTVDTVGEIRITTTTDEVKRNYYFSSSFDSAKYASLVQAGSLPNVGFNQETSFYFVITALVFDPVFGQVTESSYSAELEGAPITITTGIKDLPARTQNDIILSYTTEMVAANPGIDMKPGAVLRDLADPVSEEQARTYVIQDFLSRSLSVTSLQAFDDADGDGVSDPPDRSVLKKALQVALYLTSVNEVQRIIDDQFDKLAANVNVIRRTAQSAVGSVIFYTDTAPVRDMQVQEGGIVNSIGDLDSGIASQSYRCSETKAIQLQYKDSYYNSITKRYELEVAVIAVNAGSAGNVDSYRIKNIASGADTDFRVENTNPIEFGSDIESNHDLTSRIQLAFFADTGTEGGYAKTAISVPGVRDSRIEKAGDPLMWRDYETSLQKHLGGKVDIYVQGVKIKQVYDQIAFSFSSGIGGLSGEQFTILNATAYQFKSENVNVTAHTPIFEVNRVSNTTRGVDYNISGYRVIGDGDTIELDSTLNSSIGLASTDIVRVDYRYRSSDVFVLKNQPVENVVSVVGQLSGTLGTENWEVVKLQDPVEEGGSTIAQDGIRIKFANNLPVTDFQSILDESHVLIQGIDEPLNFIGVDPQSVVITNTDKTLTYGRDADYTMSTQEEQTIIRMMETGRIVTGQTVLISYVAIENFTVTYTVNSLLTDVQTKVDKMKHACADVIVKKAVQNAVDFIMTVVPKAGVTNFEQLTSQIQTAVSNYITHLGVGVSITQGEVIHIIQSVADVDYVVIPFIKMAKANDSLIVRDNIGTATFQVYAVGIATAYISAASVLTYKTVDKGGSENLFRGIFENSLPMVLQADPLDVSGGAGRAYIQADGRIVVSTKDGNLPETKSYQVAYYVEGETGASDIQVNSLEYLKIGTFSVSYDTPRTQNRQAF